MDGDTGDMLCGCSIGLQGDTCWHMVKALWVANPELTAGAIIKALGTFKGAFGCGVASLLGKV